LSETAEFIIILDSVGALKSGFISESVVMFPPVIVIWAAGMKACRVRSQGIALIFQVFMKKWQLTICLAPLIFFLSDTVTGRLSDFAV
jgi:hypothetical protein